MWSFHERWLSKTTPGYLTFWICSKSLPSRVTRSLGDCESAGLLPNRTTQHLIAFRWILFPQPTWYLILQNHCWVDAQWVNFWNVLRSGMYGSVICKLASFTKAGLLGKVLNIYWEQKWSQYGALGYITSSSSHGDWIFKSKELHSVCQITSKPLEWVTLHTNSSQLAQQDFVVNCIKGFT